MSEEYEVQGENRQYDPEAQAFEAKVSLIKGALYGGLLGSAMGGLVQGIEKPNEQIIFSALNLNGGGQFNLAPGQLSDEGELILQISKAVLEMIQSKTFDVSALARNVLLWKEDSSFKNNADFVEAFQKVSRTAEKAPLPYLLVESSFLLQNSTAFAEPLVGLIPYAIFLHQYPIDIFPKLILPYVSLFSPSQLHVDICLFVAVFVKHNIESLGDFDFSYSETKNFFQTTYPSDDIEQLLDIVENGEFKIIQEFPPGDIRQGFLLALYTSFKNLDFLTTLSVALNEGAATSVNSTICGVFAGLKNKFEGLPEQQVELIQIFNPEAEDVTVKRPSDRKAFEIELYLQSLINDFILGNNRKDDIWASIEQWDSAKDFLHLAEHEQELIHTPPVDPPVQEHHVHRQPDPIVSQENKEDSSPQLPITLDQSHMNPKMKPVPQHLSVQHSSPVKPIVDTNGTSSSNSSKKETKETGDKSNKFPVVIVESGQPYNFTGFYNIPICYKPRQLSLGSEKFDLFLRINKKFQLVAINARENSQTKEVVYEFATNNFNEILDYLNRGCK